MKYLILLFLFSGCFSSEQTILEISPTEIYYAKAVSELECTSQKTTLFRTIYLAKVPFTILCKKDYLGGFWFKRQNSLKLAQADADAGNFWSHSSLIFNDDDLGLIIWKQSHFIKDRAFSCEITAKDNDCSKITPKYSCEVKNSFYKLVNDKFEETPFSGNKPKRKLKLDSFYADNCSVK
jgi:hypothetical protein